MPTGEEREVALSKGAAIDGAPIAYIVTLAAVVAVLTMIPIPITFVVGTGRNFPMSQGVYPLMGWLLGPLAGALADGIGALVGLMINPQNTSSLLASLLGAAMGGLAAGSMRGEGRRRRRWWLPLTAVFVIFYGLYAGRAVFVNRAVWWHVLLGSFINWSALLLFALPTRAFLARLLADANLRRVAVGLFVGTWMIAGLVHLSTGWLVYWQVNWPNGLWLVFAGAAPFEHIARCIIGTVIGVGVISGLRAIGLVKPIEAAY
jgi:hypothetical protein